MTQEEVYTPLCVAVATIAQRLAIKFEAQQIDEIVNFTIRQFKDLSIEEIILAFELVAAQKFTLGKGVDHYGVLNPSYWGKVLSGYKEYRVQETRREIAMDRLKQVAIDTGDDTEKNNETMRKGVLKSWEYFKEHDELEGDIVTDIVSEGRYRWLRSQGLCQKATREQSESMEAEAIKHLKAAQRSRVSKAKSNRETNTIINEQLGRSDGDKWGQVYSVMYKISLRRYFEELQFNDEDLDNLI
jgi:hypothetical protein